MMQHNWTTVSIVTELEQGLQYIEEIDGTLKVTNSFPLISLSFFKNLKIITGNGMGNSTSASERSNYTLHIRDNTNMKELFDFKARNGTRLEISTGKIFIHNNPKLCMKKINELKNYTNIQSWDETDVSSSTNGDREACEIIDMEITTKENVTDIQVVWKNHNLLSKLHDRRQLVGYYIYYRRAETNVTKYDGRDACSNADTWLFNDLSDQTDSDTLAQLVTGLTPATRYALYIQAYMVTGSTKGGESEIVYRTTLPTNPSDPRDVVAEALNDTALEIRWKRPLHPNGNLTHYKVRLKPLPQMRNIHRDYCGDAPRKSLH